MRSRSGLAAAAVVLSALWMPVGCGEQAQPGRGDAKTSAQKKSPGKTAPAMPGLPDEVPVTVEFLGLAADKEHARYRIHVMTEKPVVQVDVGIVYTGASGKEERETVVWQNPANKNRPPTEKGKTYEDQAAVGKGATGVICRVLHVVYKDMTGWAPSK